MTNGASGYAEAEMARKKAKKKAKKIVYSGAEKAGGMMDSLGGMMSEPMDRGRTRGQQMGGMPMEPPMMESMMRNGSTPTGPMPMTRPLKKKGRTRKTKKSGRGR